MKHFLIVKTSAIGDVVQTLPVVTYLKNRFPDCAIDWVVEEAGASILKAHPDLSEVIVIDTKTWRKDFIGNRHSLGRVCKKLKEKTYDTLFDLQGNTKSAVVTLLAKAKAKVGYGWKSVAEKTNCLVTNHRFESSSKTNVSSRYTELLQHYFEDKNSFSPSLVEFKLTQEEENRLSRLGYLGFQRPRFMVCFGSKWVNKRLSDAALKDFLIAVEEKIHPHFFFIYGNKEESKLADELEILFPHSSHAVGGMSLPLWQRFMQIVEAVITMDSAALHLCATTNTPSFSFFGPSAASVYKPVGSHHSSYQGICPYGNTFEKRCSLLRTCETGACLRQVSPEVLAEAFCDFWKNASVLSY